MGNTALHLAIKTSQIKFVKILFAPSLDSIDNTEEIYGQIGADKWKLLENRNNKGMTALLAAVDSGNFEVFRFLLELYHYHDEVLGGKGEKILPKIIDMRCDRGENCLLKAARTN